jgi:short-subunit dehydrogenase
VHPGGIKTNIAHNARGIEDELRGQFSRIAMTSADRAARQILYAVKADKRRVLVGPDAHVIDFLARLPGSFLQRLIALGASRRRRR